MLQDAQRISAPRAIKVSISTAVWIVMCREPAILAPLSGFLLPYSSRVAIKPGISTSAIAISLRPQSAKLMSLMAQSLVGVMAFLFSFSDGIGAGTPTARLYQGAGDPARQI